MAIKSTTQWHRLVETHWGIDAVLTALPGEYDLNFLVSGNVDAVLKVMHEDCARSDVEMQVALLETLARTDGLVVPKLVPATNGTSIVSVEIGDGEPRLAWMITRLPGKLLSNAPVRTPHLFREIGGLMARLHRAMAGFSHESLNRTFKWDMRQSEWIRPHVGLIEDPTRRAFLTELLDAFAAKHGPLLARLPTQAIHNDVNDYNLLIEADDQDRQRVSGLFDFGDMIACPTIADLAIAGAYCIMETIDPLASLSALASGYVAQKPISEEEAEALWPLVLTRLAVSVVNCAIMKRERPDDPYVTVSERPAWAILDRAMQTDAAYAKAAMRKACGHAPVADHAAVTAFLDTRRGSFASIVGIDLSGAPSLDLSPAGADSPDDPFTLDLEALGARVNSLSDKGPVLGRYAEPRLIYGERAFRRGEHRASDGRTVHLGVDIFLPAATPVHAPLDGQVVLAEHCGEDGDYGGVVVLAHRLPDCKARFFTLYGHLSKASVAGLTIGQEVPEGQLFAALGNAQENGNWPPHLHFQLGIEERGGSAWPGVAYPDEADVWQHMFPNPAALLNLADADVAYQRQDNKALAERRQKRTVKNLKTSYATPLPIVRGWKQFLFDDQGRTYLDAYNNVPHVGHAHPAVVAAVHEQMRLLSTNTRYLHPNLPDYADALTARMPEGLDVCFFVNSGSEANDLAVRIARTHTSGRDVFVSGHGYHGITTLDIDISHYKFALKGGGGQQDWVHVADVPDHYRGRHRGTDAGAAYVSDFEAAVRAQLARGRRIAAFISEPFPSVGGQIVPPDGYLAEIYKAIRAAGGLAIADEVQTGLGRLGRYQWGFEQQQAVPDIVVLGKPIGNGFPIGAVITTRAIADSFANGMEFFSTFGGSTTSCAAGLAVLRVLDDERLAQNAEVTGAYLLDGLRALASQFPLIGDVRGLGLFIGVELMLPDGTPATQAAAQVVNALRERRILIGSDGPDDNVLKIRPPLCLEKADADHLLETLCGVLRTVSRSV
jgi:4-aminobutyrate aminotransferase-like enzyme/Ser/Thr protein kinase RdoA (MazF antagonist)